MANRVVTRDILTHYYDNEVSPSYQTSSFSKEVDKTKAIFELSSDELKALINRLRDERDAEDAIRGLRRSAGEIDSYENPAKIDTMTPIEKLYHWGILGMHWGVRRYQNEDGSRTAAGKKREVSKSEDYVKSRQDKNKSPQGLSNDELQKLNERLQLENTFKTLTAVKIQKSESFVASAIKKAGEQALTDFSKGVMLGSAKLLVKELSPQLAEVAFSGTKETKQTPPSEKKKG